MESDNIILKQNIQMACASHTCASLRDLLSFSSVSLSLLRRSSSFAKCMSCFSRSWFLTKRLLINFDSTSTESEKYTYLILLTVHIFQFLSSTTYHTTFLLHF